MIRFPSFVVSVVTAERTFAKETTVTLATLTPYAQVRYTTDGTAPTATSTAYTNPFTIAPLYLLAYGYGRLLLGMGGHHARKIAPFEWNWLDWIGSSEAMLDRKSVV